MPATTDSILCVLAAMPLSAQAAIVQQITTGAKWGSLDCDLTDALDQALANISRAAIADEFAADQREPAFAMWAQPYGLGVTA